MTSNKKRRKKSSKEAKTELSVTFIPEIFDAFIRFIKTLFT